MCKIRKCDFGFKREVTENYLNTLIIMIEGEPVQHIDVNQQMTEIEIEAYILAKEHELILKHKKPVIVNCSYGMRKV